MMTILGTGILRTVGPPRYGRQDLGYSPGGAQDRFSWQSGNILVGNDPTAEAWEIITPPRGVRFTVAGWAVCTGGGLSGYTEPEGIPIVSGRPFSVHAGSAVRFRKRRYGQRTYLCFHPAPEVSGSVEPPRERGPFTQVASWAPDFGTLRVLTGPEFSYLVEPQELFAEVWITTSQMSDMGVRLQRPVPQKTMGIKTHPHGQMISSPVCDGTVQLSPHGPIVLLRERQTVGGYPRILTVIDPDVDMLAQYGPHQMIRFVPVSVEEAEEIACRQRKDLETLQQLRHRER